MIDVLYAEIMKLKRSRKLFLILIGGLIPVLLMLLLFGDKNYHARYGAYIYGWSYFFDATAYYANIICPSVIAVFAGAIYASEYQLNTISTVFTYPFSRFRVFLSKLFIILGFMIVVFLCTMVFTLLAGMFLDRDTLSMDTVLLFLKINMQMVAVNFGLVPLAVLTAIISKNTLAPVTVAIIHLLSYSVLHENGLNFITPGCLPSLISTQMVKSLGALHPVLYPYGRFDVNITGAVWSMGIVFIVCFAVCIYYYRYTDAN